MTQTVVNCPSCGAAKDILNPGIVSFFCSHCGNIVYWDEEKIRLAGKASFLSEGFSRLYTGATGRLLSARFYVLGRVRYSFGRGFWDEWLLELQNEKLQWLTEDNHELALQEKSEAGGVSSFGAHEPGSKIQFSGKSFVVQEVGTASCLGIEGELPKVVELDAKYPYVDASTPDGRYTLGIEYNGEPPSVYLGRWLKHSSLVLDDEGYEW